MAGIKSHAISFSMAPELKVMRFNSAWRWDEQSPTKCGSSAKYWKEKIINEM